MGVPHPSSALSSDDADIERALHYALIKTATYAALVGQYRHHFGDRDLPEALAQADSSAFDDATQLCEVAKSQTGNPHYDLVAVTRTAFESGSAHADGDCVFCDDMSTVAELADMAVAHANAMAAAALS